MSSEELVNAYVDGQISRRTLIRRLVAGGVSLGAAVSYAHLLHPGRAEAERAQASLGFYAPAGIDVQLLGKNLAKVVAKKRVRAQVSTDELAAVQLDLFLARGKDRDPNNDQLIGGLFIELSPGTTKLSIPLSQDGIKVLAELDKAPLRVAALARDRQASTSLDGDNKIYRRPKKKK